MIDISCKFYLQKNGVTYTYCINLVEAIIRHQKLLLTSRELSTVAFSYHVKTEGILTSRVVFAVNWHECFMENKITIRTFCGCEPSKKTTLSFIKILLVLINKRGGSGLIPRCAEYEKAKRQINCGENYRINTRLNLKIRFI